jgi:YVTN family beta-propeller protein
MAHDARVAAPAALARHRSRLAVVLTSVVAAIGGTVLLAEYDSGDTVTTRGVTATLPVSGHPGWVAAGRNALWIALADTRTPVRDVPLLHLDLASDNVVGLPTFLGGEATYLTHVGDELLASVEQAGGNGSGPTVIMALDWRDGHVLARRQFAKSVGPLVRSGKDLWALQLNPAALLRLDARTLAPTARPLPLSPSRGVGLAAGAGYVWVTAPDAGDVLRIDGSRRSIARVHVGGFPAGIAVAGGSIWLADRDGGRLVRLEPSTLQPVGEPLRLGGKPFWVATAGRYLFAGDAASGTVSRIDVRSGKAAGPPIRVARPTSLTHALAVTPAGNSVWVSSFASKTLTRVSASPTSSPPAAILANTRTATPNVLPLPLAGKVIANIPVPTEGGPFTVGEGAVWAMSNVTSTLMRIDPSRNAVVAKIKVPFGEDAAAGEGAVWISHPLDDTVSRIDPKTNTVSTTIDVRGQPSGVAVSPGAVWIAGAGGPSVTRIDPTTNRVVATIRVGSASACCSPHMNLIASADAVWVALPSAKRIVRIDPRRNTVAATVKLDFVPCGFAAFADGAVWSAGADCSYVVARIDPRAKRVTAELTEPHAVGVVHAFGSVWVASLESGNIERIDPQRARAVARLHVGGFPVRLAAGFGSLWVNDDKGRVLRIQPQG